MLSKVCNQEQFALKNPSIHLPVEEDGMFDWSSWFSIISSNWTQPIQPFNLDQEIPHQLNSQLSVNEQISKRSRIAEHRDSKLTSIST